MPEVFLPAEVLMIGILYPAPHRFFVRYVKRVTQIGQTNHQANRHARPAFFRVQFAKFALEHLPVNQPAQPVQLMPVVENALQAVTEHVQLRTGNLLLRLHRKSPEIEG